MTAPKDFTVPQQRIHDDIAGVTIDLIAGDPPRMRIWRHAEALLDPSMRRDIVFDAEGRTAGSTGTLVRPCPDSREVSE